MPIYEYVCHHCGNEFETLVRSGATPECPSCHSTELKKQLSTFATAGASSAAVEPEACATCACGHMRGAGACALNGREA